MATVDEVQVLHDKLTTSDNVYVGWVDLQNNRHSGKLIEIEDVMCTVKEGDALQYVHADSIFNWRVEDYPNHNPELVKSKYLVRWTYYTRVTKGFTAKDARLGFIGSLIRSKTLHWTQADQLRKHLNTIHAKLLKE